MPRTKKRKARRRVRGEGTLYQKTRTWTTKAGATHSKTLWVAAISEGFVAEKGRQRRRRRFFYGANASAAREARDKYLGEAGKETPEGDRATLTVSEFADRFFRHIDDRIAGGELRETTKNAYDQIVRLYVLPTFGDVPIVELSSAGVKRFYDSLRSKVSSSRIARVHVILGAMLNLAVEEHVLASSPLDAIKRAAPRHRRAKVEALTERQALQLRRVAQGHRLEALVTLALTTGMRQGELFALRWSDVDLRRRAVYVRRSAQEIRGAVTFVEPKTPQGNRRITLSAVAVEALRGRQRLAKREARSVLVFPDEHGRPLRKDPYFRKDWDPLRKAAGLPDLNFHRLRHTAASLLLIEGVHPKIVSEMLGHSSISLTLDTYSHLIPTMQAGAADAFDRVFGRPPGRRKSG
ncbi:MAG TPA: tyrosine-type recombinase/integrase [Candidatus Cybelea sp.]